MSNKPREFWINRDFETNYDKIIFTKKDVSVFKKDFNTSGEYIHVREITDDPSGEEVFDRVIEALKEFKYSAGPQRDQSSIPFLVSANFIESQRESILKGKL